MAQTRAAHLFALIGALMRFQILLRVLATILGAGSSRAQSTVNLQLRIWNLRAAGQTNEADALERLLERYLLTGHFEVIGLMIGGGSDAGIQLIRYDDGTEAVMKGRAGMRLPHRVNAVVAAFRVDQLYRVDRVPVAVRRYVDGVARAIQIRVNGLRRTTLGPGFMRQVPEINFFDALIADGDQRISDARLLALGRFDNLSEAPNGRVVLHDHEYAFGPSDLGELPLSFPNIAPRASSAVESRVAAIPENDLLTALSDLQLGPTPEASEAWKQSLLGRRRALLAQVMPLRSGPLFCPRSVGP